MAIKTPKKYKEMEFKNLLLEFVRLMEPEIYVELGVKKGYTFYSIAPLVELAVAVDINPIPIDKDYIVERSGNIYSKEGWEVEGYWMKTDQFSTVWKKKIDFLFIDADHKFESVLNDIAMMTKFLNPYQSLIFLHDTYPVNGHLLSDGYCSTAWKAARYLRSTVADFEIMTVPGPWAGLSILRYAPLVSGRVVHGWMDRFIPGKKGD